MVGSASSPFILFITIRHSFEDVFNAIKGYGMYAPKAGSVWEVQRIGSQIRRNWSQQEKGSHFVFTKALNAVLTKDS